MKKNGEIELLRFVFAMIIVIFHFEFNYGFGIFTQGRIGVEFFFLVTGVLMAKTTEKVHIESHSIPNQTYAFILKKIKSFYPCFIVVFVLRCILELLVLDKIPIAVVCRKVLLSIPGLLLFKMNGISYEECIDVGGDWFLSANKNVFIIICLCPIIAFIVMRLTDVVIRYLKKLRPIFIAEK